METHKKDGEKSNKHAIEKSKKKDLLVVGVEPTTLGYLREPTHFYARRIIRPTL